MSAKNKSVSKEMLQRWEERKNIILSRHYRIGGNEAERSVRIADRKSTRLNSSHLCISYAVFCLKKKK